MEELELRLEEETVLVINLIETAKGHQRDCWEVRTPDHMMSKKVSSLDCAAGLDGRQ